MSYTYFIADLHLSQDRPDITACLADFLSGDVQSADALYVLGDLFEYWIGDDDRNDFTDEVAQLFKSLNDKGIPIYYVHGNRDFLIRKSFCQRSGMQLLDEQTVIDLYGTPTLILHGDELCTQDIAYQAFRAKARSWWWPRLILALPLFVRRKIAENGRRTSQKNQQNLTMEIMDVTHQAVVDVMQQHGVKRLIHGHTHRPAIHELEINKQKAQRIVLGDWYEQGSMLRVTPQHTDLVSTPLLDA